MRDDGGNVVKGADAYVQRLRIYPHALREENAYYSSDKMALLFGYFRARGEDTAQTLPGSQVFCALSNDIIAHETTHALLDGLHPRFQEETNPDVLAFHEAFADIVALFQHFTIPEAVLHQIRHTRGDLEQENLLGQLAVQFGFASGMHGALRSAIGATDPNTGQWSKAKPTREDYTASDEPHARGAVLVSAVFAAFVTIYRARSADLIRLATNGTGVLPAGEISHRSCRAACRRSGQGRGSGAQHVHPRARLLPAGRRDLRRLSTRHHHRRSRPRPARRSRLPGRLHFGISRSRHFSDQRRTSRGGQPGLGDAAAFARSSEGSQPSGRRPSICNGA